MPTTINSQTMRIATLESVKIVLPEVAIVRRGLVILVEKLRKVPTSTFWAFLIGQTGPLVTTCLAGKFNATHARTRALITVSLSSGDSKLDATNVTNSILSSGVFASLGL